MIISKKNAQSLATSYQAYIEGVNAFNDSAIAVWGPILLRAQEATGVEMQKPDLIERMVASAAGRLRAVAA